MTSKNIHENKTKMGKNPYLHKCDGYGGLRRACNPSFFNFLTFFPKNGDWVTKLGTKPKMTLNNKTLNLTTIQLPQGKMTQLKS